jgi:hypothetical protein
VLRGHEALYVATGLPKLALRCPNSQGLPARSEVPLSRFGRNPKPGATHYPPANPARNSAGASQLKHTKPHHQRTLDTEAATAMGRTDMTDRATALSLYHTHR